MSRFCEQDNGAFGVVTGTNESRMFPSLDKITYTPMLEPDVQFGQFVIKQHLDGLSLGEVYIAHDTVRGHDVTVQIIDIGPPNVKVPPEQLQRERAAYDRIQDHRHVLKVYGLHIVDWGGGQFLVISMEYADGGTFRRWLNDHIEDWHTRRTEGLAYFKQVCQGVASVHHAGMFHTELKPENLSFVRGVLKVSNIGTSSLIRHLAYNRTCSSHAGFETPQYIPQEQFVAQDPNDFSPQVDIYGLGILLYEIVHPQGRIPFDGRCEHLPVPCPPGTTETEARVIGRCLEKNPANRYQRVQELLDDLEGRLDSPSASTESLQMHQLWQRACRCVEEGQFDDAERLCRQLCCKCASHEDAIAMLDELERRRGQADRLYIAIEQGLDDRNLDELGSLLSEAVETYPGHPGGYVIQVRLGAKARQYRHAMLEGAAAACRGDWAASHSWFQGARQLNPGARQAENATHFASKVTGELHESRRFINEAMAAGDSSRAMALARGTDEYIEDMARMIVAPQGGDRI